MPHKKSSLLPDDFSELLEKYNTEALIAIFTKCDVNAREADSGKTALAFASVPDHVIRWLVNRGADVSLADKEGNTPLHIRSCIQNARVEILLEVGAEINSRNHQGNTALHIASASGNVSAVRTLLCSGARADMVNEAGLCALEYALQQPHTDLRQITSISELLLVSPVHSQAAFPWFFNFFAESKRGHNERVTEEMQKSVRRIGHEVEKHIGSLSAEKAELKRMSLARLYQVFGF